MDYIKEATLKQEKDHQRLLAAIRKAEEADLEESNIDTSSDSETDSNVVNGNSDAQKKPTVHNHTICKTNVFIHIVK